MMHIPAASLSRVHARATPAVERRVAVPHGACVDTVRRRGGWRRGGRLRRTLRGNKYCRDHTSSGHTAHYYPCEITVHYRFHPRHGQKLTVDKRQEYRGEAVYFIRLPEGPLAHLPVWMTEPAAADFNIVTDPRLSLEALMELRRLVYSALSSVSPVVQSGENGERCEAAAVEPAGMQDIPSTAQRSRSRGTRPTGAVTDVYQAKNQTRNRQ